jgi:hypothetical protein
VGFDLALKMMNFGDNMFRTKTIVSDEELKEAGLY